MSMRTLTRLIQARVDATADDARPFVGSRERLHVHEARKEGAEVLSRRQCAQILKSHAIESASRPSPRPYVSITPELAMVIAKHLEKREKREKREKKS